MRLDLYLAVNRNISRQKAIDLIKNGNIKVDSKIAIKPSLNVDDSNVIELHKEFIYVSRAGEKLALFLKDFTIEMQDKTALDIGSNKGGFAEVLLSYDVQSLTCIDTGDELDSKIKQDKRVKFVRSDIRNFTDKKFEIITCDISFISLHLVLDSILNLSDGIIIFLFKPQFEVGRSVKRNKKGVVLDTEKIQEVKKIFIDKCTSKNLRFLTEQKSQIKGKEGNEEYFIVFSK